MPEYLAPGVYVEELDTGVTSIPGVSTSAIDIEMARRLVSAIRPVVEHAQPDWTNFDDVDPGVTLIQLFAWVAEGLLYQSGSDFSQRREAVLRALTQATLAANSCATARETLKRPRYYVGRLMDAATFQLEQDYHREKRRLHNRNLHGVGIVSGLEVQVNATAHSNDPRIVIGPGYAIDGCGEEITVPVRVELALPSKGEAAFVSLRHWDHPCAQSIPQGETLEVSCIEDACLFATVEEVSPPGLAIARLLRSKGSWTVDAAFVPTHI